MVKDPAPSVQELHLIFTLWEKLLGHNDGHSSKENYDWQLHDYMNKCEDGIPRNQIGRIMGVRKVGDAKSYGSYFNFMGIPITYIGASLCKRDEEMEQYEELFNNLSEDIRARIHITGNVLPNKIVENQLAIAGKLDEAYGVLSSIKNFRDSLSLYKELSFLQKRQREMSLDSIFYDNLVLEQMAGQLIAERAFRNSDYYIKFFEDLSSGIENIFYNEPKRIAKADDIIFGLNSKSNNWKYDFKNIREIYDGQETKRPKFSAPILLSLAKERKAIYSPETIETLSVDE